MVEGGHHLKYSSNPHPQGLKSYWEKRRDGPLMLATIRDDTWNMLNMQHIIWKDGIILTSPVVVHVLEKNKGPAHMVEGDHDFTKSPQPQPTPSHVCHWLGTYTKWSLDVVTPI